MVYWPQGSFATCFTFSSSFSRRKSIQKYFKRFKMKVKQLKQFWSDEFKNWRISVQAKFKWQLITHQCSRMWRIRMRKRRFESIFVQLQQNYKIDKQGIVNVIKQHDTEPVQTKVK
ncbi:Hypothetical_protein [Hexamita inflata]|uniref:Hypothetical_protein n=1 Tax=Hexamita inflata TaxID=28002 RepID=A0AA86V4B1_9EUKA|nr:Hypothetical protein HINF_LOCUS44088 [Hexamita inflata]